MLSLARESEALALGLPVRRQGMAAHEGPGRQLRRLTALKDRLDNVRGEEGKRQDATDVAAMQGLTGRDGLDRCRLAAGQLPQRAARRRSSTYQCPID